ncbi:uncharacterized protein LOC143984095 [Lithobates pipiens]
MVNSHKAKGKEMISIKGKTTDYIILWRETVGGKNPEIVQTESMELHYCTECLQVALIFSLVVGGASRPQVLCTNTSRAVLGGDAILSCEFQSHLDVLQVTWQKKKGKITQTMATYSEKFGSNIAAPFRGHVSVLSASSRNSSIKLSKLEKEDEACYLCLFNSYPDGAFKGEVSLNNISPPLEEHPNKVASVEEELDMEGANKASRPQVLCTHTSRAVLGGDVILSCEIQADLDVVQVTWQKKKGKNIQNMVTYSEKFGSNIAAPFQGHVSILTDSLRTSSIKLSKLEKEDEACYLCLFNAYPDGAFEGEVSLNNISDQEIHETHLHYSRARDPIVLTAVILVMVISIVFYYTTRRKKEPVTPKKLDKAETGQVTPNSKHRSDEVNNGSTKVVNSSLYSPMYDSGKETPSSSEVTPSKSIHKESPDSSLNQRKRQTPRTPTSVKRLVFE